MDFLLHRAARNHLLLLLQMKRAHEQSGAPKRPPLRQARWAAQHGADLLSREQRRELRARDKSVVKRCFEYGLEAPPPSEQADGAPVRDPRHTGRALLASFDGAFRYLFEHSDIRLGEKQKRLVDMGTIALLGRMFRHDLVANLKWLRRRFDMDALIDTLCALFPRRQGKTEAAAVLIAVVAVSLPNGNCLMYNLTQPHAKEFLDSVWRYLEKFQHSTEYGFTVKSRDLNKYYKIRINKWGTLNVIQSYGGAAQGEAKIDPRMGNAAVAAAA
jgi:hypothetical protein